MSLLLSRFDELLRSNQHETLYAELYASDVESIEADGQTAKGMEGIGAKNEWWFSTFDVLSWDIEGPFPHGENAFAYIYDIRTKSRATAEENAIREVAVYDVRDGKIVRERFFYTGGE